MTTDGTDWRALTAVAALASHRLVGWIYWDPAAVANYAALGIPDGAGYYLATRAASIAAAGDDVVTAVFGSIHPDFVSFCLDLCRRHTTFEAAAEARDAAVEPGLHRIAPDLCDGLAELGPDLWAAAGELVLTGRPLCASLLGRRREDQPLLSAWLAVNCIREWRGDTHWAIHAAEGIDGTMAGLLDGAWRGHDDDWLPRSRGADDDALAAALARLEARGLASDGRVDEAGIAYRQELEDRLDDLCAPGWQALGEAGTRRLVQLVEPHGTAFVEHIDRTAGPRWMPAARDRTVRA